MRKFLPVLGIIYFLYFAIFTVEFILNGFSVAFFKNTGIFWNTLYILTIVQLVFKNASIKITVYNVEKNVRKEFTLIAGDTWLAVTTTSLMAAVNTGLLFSGMDRLSTTQLRMHIGPHILLTPTVKLYKHHLAQLLCSSILLYSMFQSTSVASAYYASQWWLLLQCLKIHKPIQFKPTIP